ncbi:MAG: hypothetical protein O3A55_04805 [Bacteroidetes bacterium]|nr:hypothetical protein [Bacteroidota bacterium]
MKKIVIDSDIIVEHLTVKKYPSILRKLLSKYFCYTTVFNAIELFSKCKTDLDRQSMAKAMSCIKLLGMNPKPSISFGKTYAKGQKKNIKETYTFIATLCIEAKLTLATLRPTKYSWIKNLQILKDDSF